MYDCETCGKTLKSKRSFERHILTCAEKMVARKQAVICPLCQKVFSRADSKRRHEAKNMCQSMQSADTIYNQSAETINNNNNITINITPPLAAFGKENTQDLYDNQTFVKKCIFQALPGILKLVEARFFSNKHPENQNIIKDNKRDEFIKVYNGKKWEYRLKDDIILSLLRHTTNVSDSLIEKYLDGEEIDEEDDSEIPVIEKLTGYEREDFIRRIQGYLQIMKTLDFDIEENAWRGGVKDDLTKSKIVKIVDEFIYNNSGGTEKEIKLLKLKIKQLEDKLKAIKH